MYFILFIFLNHIRRMVLFGQIKWFQVLDQPLMRWLVFINMRRMLRKSLKLKDLNHDQHLIQLTILSFGLILCMTERMVYLGYDSLRYFRVCENISSILLA